MGATIKRENMAEKQALPNPIRIKDGQIDRKILQHKTSTR